MKAIIDSKLIIKNYDQKIFDYCQKNLVLDNPDYYKKEKMGKWTGNTPRTLSLYERMGADLLLPFGCIRDVWNLFGHNIIWSLNISPFRRFNYDSHIKLYPYQENAVQRSIKGKNGVLVMPCGSGKTQCGLEIISRLGGRALWLTHTQDLLNQSKRRAESVLKNVGTGTITDGKVDIGRGITFATVQTMAKIDLTEYKDIWDVVVVDECMPADTLIDTPTGKKALKNLCIDDMVISYNEQLHEWEYKRITHLFKHKAHDIVKVKLSNGEEMICTKNHPIYTRSGIWVNAERLVQCDHVLHLMWERIDKKERAALGWVRVESVEIQEQTSDGTFRGLCPDGYVYNIEVEDNNNYFADGYLVHNCQRAAGSPTRVTQFYKVLSNLCCRYKIGLTATPYRADGLEKSMFALLGEIIHEVPKEAVKATTCPIKVQQIETGWMPNFECVLRGDGTIDYNKVIDTMIHDEERFKLVMREILHLYVPTMVLANRVEYLQRMCDEAKNHNIKAVCLSGAGQSKKAKAERKQALEALNNGELDCIFCTYSLAAEGLDVPNLRYVVFATPEKNDVTVTQATGRVGRKAEGKEYGTVIDFVDDFGMYKKFYKERLKVYKKLNCDIIE